MSEPIVHSYVATTTNVSVLSAPTAKFNTNTGKVRLSFKYTINSWNTGSYLVKYKVTPVGGSQGSWLNATIGETTIGTNGGVLRAKHRQVSQVLTWETYKDLLPQNYSNVMIQLTTKDSDSTAELHETNMGALDFRQNISNVQKQSTGKDTTPTFTFECGKALKSFNVTPVLEISTTADISVIDHTVTAFSYWTGSAWATGSATLGQPVLTTSNLKMRMTTVALSGTEYWRIKLVPVDFV